MRKKEFKSIYSIFIRVIENRVGQGVRFHNITTLKSSNTQIRLNPTTQNNTRIFKRVVYNDICIKFFSGFFFSGNVYISVAISPLYSNF